MKGLTGYSTFFCTFMLMACTTTEVSPPPSVRQTPAVTPAPAVSGSEVSRPAEVIPPVQEALPVVTLPATPPPPPPAKPVSGLLSSVQQAIAAGDYDRGAALVERALRISPRDAELWLQLAQLRNRQGRPADAVETAKRAQAFAGNNAELRRQIDSLLQQLGQ